MVYLNADELYTLLKEVRMMKTHLNQSVPWDKLEEKLREDLKNYQHFHEWVTEKGGYIANTHGKMAYYQFYRVIYPDVYFIEATEIYNRLIEKELNHAYL